MIFDEMNYRASLGEYFPTYQIDHFLLFQLSHPHAPVTIVGTCFQLPVFVPENSALLNPLRHFEEELVASRHPGKQKLLRWKFPSRAKRKQTVLLQKA